MTRIITALIAAALLLVAPAQPRADVNNGVFSGGLTGWLTLHATDGSPPVYTSPSGSVTVNSGGQAEIATQAYNQANPIAQFTLYQEAVDIPAGTARLMFDAGFSTAQDSSSPPAYLESPPDYFSISYSDPDDLNSFARPSFFRISSTGVYIANARVGDYSAGIHTYSIDISILGTGPRNLYFDVIDMYDGYGSIATLDNIRFEADGAPAPVPEPGTMVLLGSGLAGLAGWGRKRFGR